MGILIGIGNYIGSSSQSLSSYWTQQLNFYELWKVTGAGTMTGLIKGDPLTITGAGLNAIYAVPDNATYKTRDTDYVFHKSDGSVSTLCDGNRLIAYDFPRIIVKYLDVSPYTIEYIGILDTGQSVNNKMRDDFHLSRWWNNTLSAYGATKQNRGIGQLVWVAETVTPPIYAEYTAVYNELTTKPSDAIRDAQNAFVKALVDGGVWAKLDRLFVFAQTVNSASEALLDWLHPADAAKKAALISTPTFTALEGFTGDGIGKAISSEYNPTTDAIHYSQNSCCAFAYNRANKAGEACILLGTSSTFPVNELILYNRYTDDKMYHKNNQETAYSSFANTDARGMFISTRAISTVQVLYKNKTPNSDNQTATRIPTQKIPFLNRSDFNGWIWRRINTGRCRYFNRCF
jgi:hypothetical protein